MASCRQGDLRVGIETQVFVRKDQASQEIGAGTLRQNRLYGHPTLANRGNSFRGIVGGELLYSRSRGWIINRNSGRYNVTKQPENQQGALMEIVRALFKKLINLDVRVSSHYVKYEPPRSQLTGGTTSVARK